MRILLAQLNPTLGHFKKNSEKIIKSIHSGQEKKCDLIIFPELCLTGYPPRDLLVYEKFYLDAEKSLKKIVSQTSKITAVLGTLSKNSHSSGRPLYNSALVIQNKKIIGQYHKQLLPYYDVFDEPRYFEPGKKPLIFTLDGIKFGITICEDIWNEKGFLKRQYTENSLDDYKKKVDWIINLSASPFERDKPQKKRVELLKKIASKVSANVLLCNMVGGNDEIIHDGCSLIVDKKGTLLKMGQPFEEELIVFDTETKTKEIATKPWPFAKWATQALTLGISDYVHKSGFEKVCLGLSGGVDSSVVACLATQALGQKNVKALCLTTRFTSSTSVQDSRSLAKQLGISLHEIDIQPFVDLFINQWKKEVSTEIERILIENIQPRFRMLFLMAFANQNQCLLLNTSNKSELATGYATIYGDTAGAIAPLGDLLKTEVYELANYYFENFSWLTHSILKRPPTAELWEGQTDEDTLPAYEKLDKIVQKFINSAYVSQNNEWLKFYKFYGTSEFKRAVMPPILKLSERAIGYGRRIPLCSPYFKNLQGE